MHATAILAWALAGCGDSPEPPTPPEPAVEPGPAAPTTPDWCPVQGEAWKVPDGWQEWLTTDVNRDGTADRVVADGSPGGLQRQVRMMVSCAGTERVALAAEADGVRVDGTRHAGFAVLTLLSRDPVGRPRIIRYLFSPAQGAYLRADHAAAELGCPAAGLRIAAMEPVSDMEIALDGVTHAVLWSGKLDDGPRADWILVQGDPDAGPTYRAVVACDGATGAVVYEGGAPAPEVVPGEGNWRPLAVGAHETRFDPLSGIYR